MSASPLFPDSLSPARVQEISHLLQRLGLPPGNNLQLYNLALTHSSYGHDHHQDELANYERLEFLGDAVLKLVVSEILYDRFPEYREGELTKIRAVVVSDARMAELAEMMQLSTHLRIGQSEKNTGGRKRQSTLACLMEALLGAIYLDGHFEALRPWLKHHLDADVTLVDLNKTKNNFKAALQELTQGDHTGLPQYRTRSVEGPPHRRVFTEEVLVNDEVLGVGSAFSKKEAQQLAAKMALEALGI